MNNKESIYIDVLFFITVMVLLVFCGFTIGRMTARTADTRQSDTVIVVKHDTALIDSPVPIIREVVRTEYLAVTDTVRINDTTYLPIPIERKVYEDSTYRAVISGYHPNLDSLWVYNTTHYVTVTNTVREKASRWGFGAAAGPSVMIDAKGTLMAGFGLTAGVRYNF